VRHTHGGDTGTDEDRIDLSGRPNPFLRTKSPFSTVDGIVRGWKWTVTAFIADDPYAHSNVASLKRWRHAHQRELTATERPPAHKRQLQGPTRRGLPSRAYAAFTATEQQRRYDNRDNSGTCHANRLPAALTAPCFFDHSAVYLDSNRRLCLGRLDDHGHAGAPFLILMTMMLT
jgi:hypothetical protein